MKKRKGVTLIELVVVIGIAGILASALVVVMVPMMNLFFSLPQQVRVNSTTQELLDTIFEGDEKARGLRFAGQPCYPAPWVTATAYAVGNRVVTNNIVYTCLIAHTSGVFATDLGNGNWMVYSSITAAAASSLTYNYADADACTGGTGTNSVVLSYDSGNRIVTRNINGAGAVAIPYYATAASGIKIDRFESNADGLVFFRYYNSAGTEMTSATPITVENIYRVDVAIRAYTGTGSAALNTLEEASVYMKAGGEIKRYTA